MTALLLAALWTTPTDTQTIDGLATYYAPGLMRQVGVGPAPVKVHFELPAYANTWQAM